MKKSKKKKMLETSSNIETIVSIISNSLIIIGALIGAFWAYHTYINNENKAGLSVNISDISYQYTENNKYYLNLNVNVKNIGNRELDIILNKTNIKLLLLDSTQLSNAKINDTLVYEITGRHTIESNLHNARMRSGVNYNFPYSAIVDKPGRYFIEFSITTDMNKYKSFFSKITTPNTRPITWQDKAFYIIPEPEKLE